ncbi:M1-specific T cell receptor beta chain-like [Scomber scombrus]|uniref:M1-specific T cell receptor beta chain-like n=1 Tax=Scomber scombrus TaxID=13677 RepID=UPI002DD9C3AB|nr:M1-specific T cell receptor beta chain-like [Scomber scombrus]
MTTLTIALYLTCFFGGTSAQMSNLESPKYVHQQNTFYSANVGQSVTLQCFSEGEAVMFYWYKQILGQEPRLVSTLYKHKSGTFHDEFNNYRFTLDTKDGNNHLTISNLHISDSATYYCASSYSFNLEFEEEIIVSVKGSGLNIQALVHQLASESIQPKGSVNCVVHNGTCDDGEHSVYWFKNSEESHSGLIYTREGRNDQCERNTNIQTHTCVYNLPMKSLNLSHAGTECAVVSCGQILFGKRTKLDVGYEVDSFVLVYFLIGALGLTTILIVLLAYAAYTMNRNCCQCKEERSPAASTPDPESYTDADELHYAAFRENNVGRSIRQRDNTQTECVYSTVKQ